MKRLLTIGLTTVGILAADEDRIVVNWTREFSSF